MNTKNENENSNLESNNDLKFRSCVDEWDFIRRHQSVYKSNESSESVVELLLGDPKKNIQMVSDYVVDVPNRKIIRSKDKSRKQFIKQFSKHF